MRCSAAEPGRCDVCCKHALLIPCSDVLHLVLCCTLHDEPGLSMAQRVRHALCRLLQVRGDAKRLSTCNGPAC